MSHSLSIPVLKETVNTGFFHMRSTCRRCGGSGSIIRNPCRKCSGAGSVMETKKVTVPVPAGENNNLLKTVTCSC